MSVCDVSEELYPIHVILCLVFPHRFKVLIEMIKPDKLDTATTLKGLDYIDVPGLSKREYKLNFFCHKEASYSAKVRTKDWATNQTRL